MGYDFNVGCVDVRVCFDEVGSENASKELRGCDWVLLRLYVDGVLHRVCGNNNAVVGFCVTKVVKLVRFDRKYTNA